MDSNRTWRLLLGVAGVLTLGLCLFGCEDGAEPPRTEAGLRFRPLQSECYDFVIPRERWGRPAVQAFRRVLEASSFLRKELTGLGFGPPED